MRKAVVRIEIHDSGVGLKKADVLDNRLFSPYVQTEIGRRQGGKGSGLGLALVRQIIKLSHGRLGVESQYGKGSMFWFELPYSMPATGPSHGRSKSRSDSLSTAADGGLGSPAREASAHVGSPGSGMRHRATGATPNIAVPLNRIVEFSATPPAPRTADLRSDQKHQAEVEQREEGQHGHKVNPDRPEVRPGITMTESTLPLLGHEDARPSIRRLDSKRSVPAEEMIITTYPPVPGSESSESDEAGDVRESGTLARGLADADGAFVDSFARLDPGSPVSPLNADRPASPGTPRKSTETSRSHRGTAATDGPVCALVVDDDKCVICSEGVVCH